MAGTAGTMTAGLTLTPKPGSITRLAPRSTQRRGRLAWHYSSFTPFTSRPMHPHAGASQSPPAHSQTLVERKITTTTAATTITVPCPSECGTTCQYQGQWRLKPDGLDLAAANVGRCEAQSFSCNCKQRFPHLCQCTCLAATTERRN